MKTIKQQDIAEKAGISQSMLSQLLAGHRRAGWRTAKRLASVVIGSTSEQWLEAPPETLRQIIAEYSQTTPAIAGRAPDHEQGSSEMPCTVNP